MRNETALLLRLNAHNALQTPLLLINPPDDPDAYHGLIIAGVLHDNYQQHLRWQHTETPTWFGCHLPEQQLNQNTASTVVLFLPKGKQRLLAQLQLLPGRVFVNSRLLVIGAIDAGIKSAGKKIDAFCDRTGKLDAARHCQAWSGVLKDQPKTDLSSLIKLWPLTFSVHTSNIASLPGVFADGRLDTGSRLLIETFNGCQNRLPKIKQMLDFGCGSGVLSLTIAQLIPDMSIKAVDSDAFALHAAALTFQQNKIQGSISATALPADIAGQYDLIVSNPPFHQGNTQTTQLSQAFIQQLPKLLNRNGQAWIVANQFLNYEAICRACGLKVTREAANNAFKVLLIKR